MTEAGLHKKNRGLLAFVKFSAPSKSDVVIVAADCDNYNALIKN